MKEPPPDEKGADGAGTPATPNRASSCAGNQNSPREYALAPAKVNPRKAEADARVSERGPAPADGLSVAERIFLEVCEASTGRELTAEAKERRDASQALLLAQSYRIADALESQGIQAYGDSRLTLVGVLSGEIRELPDFRNIVFLTAIAQRKRNPMVKDLEYFMQLHPFSRMWVFTTGVRTPLSEVRDRVTWLHRRLSKLNARPFMKAAGVSLVFRSTELGEVERDGEGTPTFHIHAHAMVKLSRKLDRADWRKLLASVRAWWRFHFKEAKRIHKVREACKYVVKPGDLDQLTPPELAELYRQLARLHLVQCLGEFKAMRKELKDADCRLVRDRDGVWQRIPNWNRGRPAKEAEPLPTLEKRDPEDWVICTLPPSCAVSSKSEPLAVVLNYNGTRIDQNRRIQALREVCGPRYREGGSPPGGEEATLLQRRRVPPPPESGGAGGQAE